MTDQFMNIFPGLSQEVQILSSLSEITSSYAIV